MRAPLIVAGVVLVAGFLWAWEVVDGASAYVEVPWRAWLTVALLAASAGFAVAALRRPVRAVSAFALLLAAVPAYFL